jgi:hypothetical protein
MNVVLRTSQFHTARTQVHRCLRPSNILFNKRGAIKVRLPLVSRFLFASSIASNPIAPALMLLICTAFCLTIFVAPPQLSDMAWQTSSTSSLTRTCCVAAASSREKLGPEAYFR